MEIKSKLKFARARAEKRDKHPLIEDFDLREVQTISNGHLKDGFGFTTIESIQKFFKIRQETLG